MVSIKTKRAKHHAKLSLARQQLTNIVRQVKFIFTLKTNVKNAVLESTK